MDRKQQNEANLTAAQNEVVRCEGIIEAAQKRIDAAREARDKAIQDARDVATAESTAIRTIREEQRGWESDAASFERALGLRAKPGRTPRADAGVKKGKRAKPEETAPAEEAPTP